MRQINIGQISAGSASSNSVATVDANASVVFRYVNPPYVLDNISAQFDGDKTVFGLTIDTANISTVINNFIIDSKDLDVAITGMVQTPYVKQLSWPWIVDYDSFKGFRVVNDTITFYNAPQPGTQASIVLRSTSQSAQQRRYPYPASSIALGD